MRTALVRAVIEHAFVQEEGTRRLAAEMRAVRDTRGARGVGVTQFTRKRMERGQLAITPRTLVVGEIPVLEAALRQLAARGYGIDFGVLADGRTALVEVNDGYGLGNYGLAKETYLDLCVARWQELTAPAP